MKCCRLRQLVSACVLSILSMQAFSQTGLPSGFTQALANAGVPASSASVMVQRLSNAPTPETLIAHQDKMSRNPASVMKIITTYAALDQLGPDFTWKNRVYIDGQVENGVLFGNLIIRGSGDPKLVLERIEELFKNVQAKGVREVRGDILLDRRVFNVPDKNPADFDGEPLRPYNAVPDGLLLNFKSIIYTFVPEPELKRVLIKSEPPISRVDIPMQVQGSAGACGDWRSSLQADFSNANRTTFSGRYPLACGQMIWPVAYVAPREYAARVIEAMWKSSGGTLAGSVREEALPRSARLLHTEESLPLSAIIADVNKFSNNVMAQQLFLTLSAPRAGSGNPSAASFAASQRNLAAWWVKTLPEFTEPTLENGSGLSRKERSTAHSMSAVLSHAANSKHAQVFADSLAIAGVDGTVVRMRERSGSSAALGNAQLKTGTLRDVAAIAGYVNSASQRYSVVAIINHGNAGAARPALDTLVEWLAKQP
jgi:serine-type D-Ala-D-Ala carboxypeptidase/endopeptidase (penicillin-binding protein 4)